MDQRATGTSEVPGDVVILDNLGSHRSRVCARRFSAVAFRPHRLNGIWDPWFLWRKYNGLRPLQFARCILRLWAPLA
jgi:hypothetical protein